MKDEVKGKAEELHGKLTGDRTEELKGKAHQAGDKARRMVRDVKEDVREGADRGRERDAVQSDRSG
jgi:uncharacterized protein YjbJ (UPF0337 family)